MNKRPNIFCYGTPIDWDAPGFEHELHISRGNHDLFDALPKGLEHSKRFIVAFDSRSRHYFAIRRFPCGEGCYCAAQAQLVTDPSCPSDVQWPEIVMPEESEEGEE